MTNYHYYKELAHEPSKKTFSEHDQLNAFLDGVYEALTRFSSESVPLTTDAFRRRRFAETLLMSRELEAEESQRAIARDIISEDFSRCKDAFRGMLFDRAMIDDSGQTYNGDNAVPDKEAKRWPYYIFIHRETGAEISERQYSKLGKSIKKQYRKVRYFDITDDNGHLKRRIYEDDVVIIEALIDCDLSTGDSIADRYFQIAFIDHPESERVPLDRRRYSIAAIRSHMKYYGPKEHTMENAEVIHGQTSKSDDKATIKQPVIQDPIQVLEELAADQPYENLCDRVFHYITKFGILDLVTIFPLKATRRAYKTMFSQAFPPSYLWLRECGNASTPEEKQRYIEDSLIPKAAANIIKVISDIEACMAHTDVPYDHIELLADYMKVLLTIVEGEKRTAK